MFSTIIVPRNNEWELSNEAKKLGFERILAVYPSSGLCQSKKQEDLISIQMGVFGDKKEIIKAKQKGVFTIITTVGDRGVFEKTKPDMFMISEIEKKDGIHQRNSGLNDVLCKIARKNKITFLIDAHTLLLQKNVAIALGRMKQNVHLCRKYKVPLAISSFASSPTEIIAPLELMSVGKLLGLSPGEAKEAVSFDL